MSAPAPPTPRWTRAAALGAAALAALLLALLVPRAWLLAAAPLVAAYMVTPVAKETWVALAEPLFGVPAPLAVLVLLGVESVVIGVVLLAFPVEKLARFAPKVERFERRVRASRLARRGLGVALGGVIALPFHSGGAILGTLAGRALGLPRLTTYFAVISGIGVRFLVVLLAYEGYVALT